MEPGTAYFTDSSQHFGIDHYKGELLAHCGTGLLFRRTPDGAVDLIADGFQFANGVALAPDESWIAVAETGGYCARHEAVGRALIIWRLRRYGTTTAR